MSNHHPPHDNQPDEQPPEDDHTPNPLSAGDQDGIPENETRPNPFALPPKSSADTPFDERRVRRFAPPDDDEAPSTDDPPPRNPFGGRPNRFTSRTEAWDAKKANDDDPPRRPFSSRPRPAGNSPFGGRPSRFAPRHDNSASPDEDNNKDDPPRNPEIDKMVQSLIDAMKAAVDERIQANKDKEAQGDDAQPDAATAPNAEDTPQDYRSRFKDVTPQYKRGDLANAGGFSERFAKDDYRTRMETGNYRGYFQTNTAQRETAQDIYLIRSTARGFIKVWYYVRVPRRKKVMFLHDLKQGNVKIENYGEILKRGFGAHPDDEAIAYMEREHGYTTRRTWEDD